jgi:hypothetical protein
VEVIFRLLVYAASVWVSNKYVGGYWVVGPVFGVAVVLFDAKSLKGLNIVRHAVFVGVSTLVYALVFRISEIKWGGDTDLFNYFIGSFPASVVTGSVLMSVAYTVIFNKGKDVMMRAMAGLVGSFYLLSFLAYFNEKSHLGWNVEWLTLMIAVWQGLYLLVFFSKSKANS